jgi:hypothetical protein
VARLRKYNRNEQVGHAELSRPLRSPRTSAKPFTPPGCMYLQRDKLPSELLLKIIVEQASTARRTTCSCATASNCTADLEYLLLLQDAAAKGLTEEDLQDELIKELLQV